MANNIPLGTYLSDGIRTGPNFADFQPGAISPQVNVAGIPVPQATIPAVGPFLKYGQGVLHSSIMTYTFSPAIYNTTDFSRSSNIVNTPISGAGAFWYGITSGASSTSYLAGASRDIPYNAQDNGSRAVQFDYPRCPTIWFGANSDVALSCTYQMFGYDVYGFKMYESNTIIVDTTDATTYPAGNQPFNFYFNCTKAFYGVTGFYANITYTEGNPTNIVSGGVATSNVFGLPQRLYASSDIISVAGGNQCVNNSIPPNTGFRTSDPELLTFLSTPGVLAGRADGGGWSEGTTPVSLLNKFVSQGFFYNDIPLNYSREDQFFTASVDTGGPVHTPKSRDVRGTVNLEPLITPASGATTQYYTNPDQYLGQNSASNTFSITYIVRGADTGINQLQSFRNSSQYLANKVPNPVAPPNLVEVLPNAYQNLGLNGYAPTNAQPKIPNVPLNSIDEYGVAQYYQPTISS